jgi:hypothetical protein
MSSHECRESALRCYQRPQTIADADARQQLLKLMANWHQLVEQIDQFNNKNNANSSESLSLSGFCLNSNILLERQHLQAGVHWSH